MSTLTAPAPSAEAAAPAKGGKKKKLVLGVVLLLVAAGAAWFFLLRPSGSSEPEPGEVLPVESIQVNLDGAHYLRLGLGLQLVAGASETDTSKAADAAIGVFSGRPMAEVNRPAVREKLRTKLVHELAERYDGAVMGVYFTEYVTQ